MTTRTSNARLPRPLATCTVAVLSLLFLAACDENEQGRVLQYQPGTYLGQPDTGLNDEQRAELRQRAQRQRQ